MDRLVILLIALGALHRMPVPTGARVIVSPILLACVVLLVGTAPSILRAAAMALIILAISIGFTLIILRVLRVPKGATI